MMKDAFASVQHAGSRHDLWAQMTAFTRRTEFETFTATLIIDHPEADSRFITLDNTPEAYRAEFDDLNNGTRDPVMQHCKHRGVPIIWDQATYVAAGKGDKWESQARFGYRCGIVFALHLPNGLHFCLGLDRDRPLPPSAIHRMVGDICLFAVHAQDAAQRLLLPESTPEREAPSLTPRQLECLRWTMEGKTAWEIGRILGISEHTAIRHVNSATHKLGAINKHQAVLKALRLKLVR